MMLKFFGLGKLLSISLLLVSCASIPYSEINRTKLELITQNSKTTQIWKTSIGKGSRDTYITIAPVVVGDTVYANSVDGAVVAISLATGEIIWRKNLPYKLDSSIGADAFNLYLGDKDGIIRAFDIQTIKQKWQTQVLGEITSIPQSDGEVLVVRVTNGKTFAFDVKTGEKLWSYIHKHLPFSIRGSANVLVSWKHVIISTSNGDIVSLNKNTGEKIWLEPITFAYGRTVMDRIVDVDATPLKVGDDIFTASIQGSLARLNINNGLTSWNIDFSSIEPVVMKNNSIVASHEGGQIMAFSKQTGTKIWQNDQLTGYNLIGPVMTKKYFVVAARSSTRLFWLNSNKIVAQSDVNNKNTDYIQDTIMSLTSTKNGVLVLTKYGNLSLHNL